MPERDAEAIRSDIERARVTLAKSVDELAYRTNPKRLVDQAKHAIVTKAQSPAGKAVIGAAGAIVVLLIVRRVRQR